MPDVCIRLSDSTLISIAHFQLFLNIRLGGKRSYFTQVKTHLDQDDVAFPCSDILHKIYQHMFKSTFFFLFLMLLHYLLSYCMFCFLDLKFKITPATFTIQIRNLLSKARNLVGRIFFFMSGTHLSKNTKKNLKSLFVSHLYAYMLWVALAIFLFSYNFSRTLFTYRKQQKKTFLL